MRSRTPPLSVTTTASSDYIMLETRTSWLLLTFPKVGDRLLTTQQSAVN